ncbi:MAG: GcrA cell cycle regulator [Alphaproteobacteria bacterium]|nr:GcrA cell cycle regulator [Alphaproteobacteria bacterium]
MAWTDDMIEKLKKMWDEGLTTGEIGRRLNMSKNSIVGKVHRLGLSGRPSPIKKKDQEQEAAKAEKKTTTPKVAKEKSKPATPTAKAEVAKPKKIEKTEVKVAPVVKEEETIDIKFIPAPIKEKTPSKAGQNVSLVELDNHTCRWPIGDPKDENFHFCGKKVRVGQTYCDEHSAIAYVKPSKK